MHTLDSHHYSLCPIMPSWGCGCSCPRAAMTFVRQMSPDRCSHCVFLLRIYAIFLWVLISLLLIRVNLPHTHIHTLECPHMHTLTWPYESHQISETNQQCDVISPNNKLAFMSKSDKAEKEFVYVKELSLCGIDTIENECREDSNQWDPFVSRPVIILQGCFVCCSMHLSFALRENQKPQCYWYPRWYFIFFV